MMTWLLTLAFVFSCALIVGAKTTVSISGTQFIINGKQANAGSSAAGLLLNSKMSQAIFDDENSATVTLWSYPDTHKWDPSRNTNEFTGNVSLYASKGLNAFTVGLQGSDPDPSGVHNQQAIVTGFTNTGQLKPQWQTRLTQVLKAADQSQMVVILTLFDLSQEHRLFGDDGTIFTAVENIAFFLLKQGSSNVMLDLADACNNAYTHQTLTPNFISNLLNFTRKLLPHVPISTSFPAGVIPPDTVLDSVDYVLLHGTGLNRTGLSSMIEQVKSSNGYQRHQVPILINQDSTDLGNLALAVSQNVSWGFYSQGQNDYQDGYCSPPVNWGINTADKTYFFENVFLLTQSQ